MYRIILFAIFLTFASLVAAGESFNQVRADPHKAPAISSVEVAFSPDGAGESLVLKTIKSAKSSIRLAAYSFTSPSVVRALTHAKQRGVDVMVLVDYQTNLEAARNRAAQRALNLLTKAGISIRTIDYLMHHDKYIIVDERHIETGSFNYTTAAAKYNSENVMVIWNNPQVAQQYIRHWQSRWQRGVEYRGG